MVQLTQQEFEELPPPIVNRRRDFSVPLYDIPYTLNETASPLGQYWPVRDTDASYGYEEFNAPVPYGSRSEQDLYFCLPPHNPNPDQHASEIEDARYQNFPGSENEIPPNWYASGYPRPYVPLEQYPIPDQAEDWSEDEDWGEPVVEEWRPDHLRNQSREQAREAATQRFDDLFRAINSHRRIPIERRVLRDLIFSIYGTMLHGTQEEFDALVRSIPPCEAYFQFPLSDYRYFARPADLEEAEQMTIHDVIHGNFQHWWMLREDPVYNVNIPYFIDSDYPEIVVMAMPSIEYDNVNFVNKIRVKVCPNMDATGGPKGGTPVMPFTNAGGGVTGGGVPAHGDMPASSTVAPPINLPNDPQIRASRDMPAQMPLVSMVGGPPDMSEMNMYQDDILNLVYRQFHLGQVTVQGTQALGSIVLRLPYGLNLLNVYAQNWARLHKRYNGRMRITFSLSAVPMIRGNLLIGIMRNMPADTVTTIAPEILQKINWIIINVNGSGEYMLDIGDARQTKFFRDVAEDPINGPPSDLADRPGIIGIVYTPFVNQFGEQSDNSVVINMRSAAISPLEDPIWGFKAYEPIDAAVTLRSLDDNASAQLVYARDFLSTIVGRSLFIDGNKVRTTFIPDLYHVEYSTGLFNGIFRTREIAVNQAPYWMSGDNKKFMFVLSEMDPLRFNWANNSRPQFGGDTYAALNEILAGTFIDRTAPLNQFLGTIQGNETIAVTNLRVNGSDDNSTTTAVQVTSNYVANFTEGRFIFVFCEITDANWNSQITSVIPVTGLNGIHTLVWPMGSDNPSTVANLPQNYYNVVVATDGQNQYLATIGGSPALRPDKGFTQFFLSLRDRMVGHLDSITVDMIDIRNNTTIGFLFTFGEQVVIRTAVPNAAGFHYRFNVDLQYLGFANARQSFGQPVSDSSDFLQPLDLVRGSNKYDILKALASIDRKHIDELFATIDLNRRIQPNATAILEGLAEAVPWIIAGGASGAGQSAMNWLGLNKKNQQEKSMQEDFFSRKFQMQWDLNVQNYMLKQRARGAANFNAQPGAVQNNSLAASGTPQISEVHDWERNSDPQDSSQVNRSSFGGDHVPNVSRKNFGKEDNGDFLAPPPNTWVASSSPPVPSAKPSTSNWAEEMANEP